MSNCNKPTQPIWSKITPVQPVYSYPPFYRKVLSEPIKPNDKTNEQDFDEIFKEECDKLR